jgi:hypothetical protein
VSTLMSTTMVLDPDENGKAADQREYRNMIGYLLYLTTTWPEFTSQYACVRALKLPHTLYIGKPFNRFLGISNTRSNLGFGTPLHLHLILLGFPMLILWVVELIEKTLLLYVIFLDLLLFVCLLTNKQLLHNPPQRSSM